MSRVIVIYLYVYIPIVLCIVLYVLIIIVCRQYRVSKKSRTRSKSLLKIIEASYLQTVSLIQQRKFTRFFALQHMLMNRLYTWGRQQKREIVFLKSLDHLLDHTPLNMTSQWYLNQLFQQTNSYLINSNYGYYNCYFFLHNIFEQSYNWGNLDRS